MKRVTQETVVGLEEEKISSRRGRLACRVALAAMLVAATTVLTGCGREDGTVRLPVKIDAESDAAFGIVSGTISRKKYFNLFGPTVDTVYLDICADTTRLVDPMDQDGGELGRQAALDAIQKCEKIPSFVELEDHSRIISNGMMVRVEDSSFVVGGVPDGVMTSLDLAPLRYPVG